MVSLTPELPPEFAAQKFVRSLHLPPQFHSVWVRNEWSFDKSSGGDEPRHIIMVRVGKLPPGIEPPTIPESFEGYEVREVGGVTAMQAPMTVATPIRAVDKY